MLNHATILGRLTRDPELKILSNGSTVVNFTVAVERLVKADQEKKTDFISCVAFGQKAVFVSDHFGKGGMIGIDGKIRTRSYEDAQGAKHYVTEIFADNISFAGDSKAKSEADNGSENPFE